MVTKWGIDRAVDVPHFKPSEDDENPPEAVDPKDIKTARAMAGALLWLTTRTRPDIAMGLPLFADWPQRTPSDQLKLPQSSCSMSRACLVVFTTPKMCPDKWGTRGQLKVARYTSLLEIFSDIAFGAGTKNRSIRLPSSLVAVRFLGRPRFSPLQHFQRRKVSGWLTVNP